MNIFTNYLVPEHSYNIYVTEVYDADTITCDIDLGFGIVLHNQKIRFYGINAPEMKGDEKMRGVLSRDILRQWILHKNVKLYCIMKPSTVTSTSPVITLVPEKCKFGRWLGIIIAPENPEPINQQLVEKGYAIYQEY